MTRDKRGTWPRSPFVRRITSPSCRPVSSAGTRSMRSIECYGAVVIAVATVRVMQVPIDDVIGVITMGDGIVSAPRAAAMGLVVPAALVIGRACRGIRAAHVDSVFFHLRAVLMVKVSVVKIVLVPVVSDPSVAAVGAVNVGVRQLRVLGLRL